MNNPVTRKRDDADLAPRRQNADDRAMALDLPPADLSEAMRASFAKCDEKIGFVPNVLRAYAHDNDKLEAFAAFYKRPHARALGAVEARTGDDRGRRVEPESLLLLPDGA